MTTKTKQQKHKTERLAILLEDLRNTIEQQMADLNDFYLTLNQLEKESNNITLITDDDEDNTNDLDWN